MEQFAEIVGQVLPDAPAEAFEHQTSLAVMRSIALRSLLHQALPAGNC